MVVARQRPGTANGIVFILLEDEYGTINLIVPAEVYERHRLIVRTEPLMLAEGKLERLAAAGGGINVLVEKVGSIAAPDQVLAEVKDFSMLDEQVRRGRAEQDAVRAEQDAVGAEQDAVGAGQDAARQRAGSEAAGEADEFRAVAPPVMSFASGRRR
jgi:error-prone DNA polymerase